MSQPASVTVDNELLSRLKTNNKGWNAELFVDQSKIESSLCGNCGNVCCDAVELGCNHNDDEIYPFCNNCLAGLIHENKDKCIINSHSNPIIVPVRSLRRAINKYNVCCPYSIQYKNKNKNNKNHGNMQQVIETNSNDDGKEGVINVINVINAINNNDINQNGCNFNGNLNELIQNHFIECLQKYDSNYVIISKLKKQNKEQLIKINKLNNTLNDKNLKIDQLNKTNIALNHKIKDLENAIKRFNKNNKNNKNNINNINNMNNKNVQTTIHVILPNIYNREYKYQMVGRDTFWGIYGRVLQSVPQLAAKPFYLELPNGYLLKENEYDKTLFDTKLIPYGHIKIKYKLNNINNINNNDINDKMIEKKYDYNSTECWYKCGNKMKINGSVLSFKSGIISASNSAYGKIFMMKGCHIFKLKILKVPNTRLTIGIASTTNRCNACFEKDLWYVSYDCYDGSLRSNHNDNKSEKYGSSVGINDIIELCVNLTKNSIFFAKNGKKFEEKNIIWKASYRLAVFMGGMGYSEGSVQMISYKSGI